MIIRDHIRFTNMDPLNAVYRDSRFVEQKEPSPSPSIYSDRFAALVRDAAKDVDIDLHEGTYCWTSGPTYETPSEVKVRRCGECQIAGEALRY